MALSLARFRSIMANQSGTAAKVYEATPATAAWNERQICTELHRLGRSIDLAIVHGCLESLCESGLVSSTRDGYIRVAVKTPVVVLKKVHDMPANQEVHAPQSPVDRLTALSVRCANLSTELKNLSGDIADAVLEIEEQMSSTDKSIEKFRQLQDLLKGIAA